MLATGTYNHPPVARFAVWGTGFETTEYQYSFCSAYNQWEYKTIIFTTDAVTTDMSFHMAGCYMQRDITIYIDDICLEKIGSMIIEENITGLYCEDYFNQIPSGNFEGNLSSTVWNQASNSFRQVTNNQLGVAAGGYSYLQIDGNVDFTHPITINGGKKYNFAFSYLAEKNTDLQIGLVNSDGTLIPPMENSGISIGSLMTVGNTNGKWQRVGYTFLSPADGAVKLVIRGTGVKINLDEIQLFLTKLAWDENRMSMTSSIKTTSMTSLIKKKVKEVVLPTRSHHPPVSAPSRYGLDSLAAQRGCHTPSQSKVPIQKRERKIMKISKTISIILISACVLFSMAACQGPGESGANDSSKAVSATDSNTSVTSEETTDSGSNVASSESTKSAPGNSNAGTSSTKTASTKSSGASSGIKIDMKALRGTTVKCCFGAS